MSKITQEQLKECLKQGMTQREIAKKFDMSQSTVNHHIAMLKGNSSLNKRKGDDIRALKSEIASLKKDLQNLHKEIPKSREIKELIHDGKYRKPQIPEWMYDSSKESVTDGIPVLFLSDVHYSETVYPMQIGGVNNYSEETADNRLEHTFKTAIDLTIGQFKKPEFDGFILALGGDMLSGNIHEELSESNESPINVAVYKLQDRLIAGIELLKEHFRNVYIPCVVGNHGRLTRAYKAKNKVYDNYEYVLYHNLYRHYRDDVSVTVDVSDEADILFKVYDKTFLMTHGDQFRGGNGIAGVLMPIKRGGYKKKAKHSSINKPFDIMMVGHFHQYIHDNTVILNGSVKGYDEYAYNGNFDFEEPQQAFFIVNKNRGITYRMPIFCDGYAFQDKEYDLKVCRIF
ncbi:MAG: winged helix-turn-helix transcriptional regulator [Pseudoalteromonas tetraodonis]|nr:winged helix-turn-helix transcriptional regulator [Pseudoalteromonas tetraodonis]